MAESAAKAPRTEVDAASLARILRCGERDVQRLARKGLCIRAGRGRYALFESIGNVVEHYRRQAAGHTSADGMADAMKSNAALKDAQRRLTDLKYAQLDAQVISITDVETLWGDLVTSAKWLFLTLPARARFEMPHLTHEDGLTLERVCRKALREVVLQGAAPSPDKNQTRVAADSADDAANGRDR